MKKSKLHLIIFILALLFCNLNMQTVVYSEENWPSPPDISASSAIVMEVNSGAILYEKNSHEAHYPASITKIMTSLLAIENCPLSNMVLFSKDAVYNVEGTQVGITPNEEISLSECLYGLMLASGNEIAYAIAEHVGGTYENFVTMMNTRAAELGCTNTHFNNPHGLPDENHYTCAYDMALISSQAYKNKTFKNISGTKYHVIPPSNIYAEERAMSNHHKMLVNSSYHYDYCTGGKTGYTNAARYNLVTYAEKDDLVLVCVIMKDEESALQYNDTKNLFNYCFDNFHTINIAGTGLGNNLDSSGLFPIQNNIFSNNTSAISFDENASVIVPNSIDFTEVSSYVTYEGASAEDTAHIIYNYGEHVLGNIPVIYKIPKKTTATTNTAPKYDNEKNILKVNIKIILYVVIGVIIAALMVLAILKFVFNYHINVNNSSFFKHRKNRKNKF